MAKCPKCGAHLKWYNLRAECKHCGVNIPNYNWEGRLEDDANVAEESFAKLHYSLANFKSGTVGNPFRIIRLVLTVLPLVALVVPLINLQLTLPFFEKSQSVSFLTFVLDYLTKLDFMGGFSLMSGTALGGSVTFLMLSILMAFLAIVAAVINFFVVLVAAIKLKAGFNIFLNIVSTAAWVASAVLLSVFTQRAAELSINIFSGSVQWGYLVGVALFFINIVINIITAKSFKKQKKEQPTLEQAIEAELRSVREASEATDEAVAG